MLFSCHPFVLFITLYKTWMEQKGKIESLAKDETQFS